MVCGARQLVDSASRRIFRGTYAPPSHSFEGLIAFRRDYIT